MSFYFLYNLAPWAMLFLRIALAAIFIAHGPPKLKNAEQMAPNMGMSPRMVKLVGLVEIVCAISLLVGLLAVFGALGLVIVMIGALHFKINKWHVPFAAMDKMGWEFDLIILAAALLIVTTGAGPLSIDAYLGVY